MQHTFLLSLEGPLQPFSIQHETYVRSLFVNPSPGDFILTSSLHLDTWAQGQACNDGGVFSILHGYEGGTLSPTQFLKLANGPSELPALSFTCDKPPALLGVFLLLGFTHGHTVPLNGSGYLGSSKDPFQLQQLSSP